LLCACAFSCDCLALCCLFWELWSSSSYLSHVHTLSVSLEAMVPSWFLINAFILCVFLSTVCCVFSLIIIAFHFVCFLDNAFDFVCFLFSAFYFVRFLANAFHLVCFLIKPFFFVCFLFNAFYFVCFLIKPCYFVCFLANAFYFVIFSHRCFMLQVLQHPRHAHSQNKQDTNHIFLVCFFNLLLRYE
jgi:hypothetical protein